MRQVSKIAAQSLLLNYMFSFNICFNYRYRGASFYSLVLRCFLTTLQRKSHLCVPILGIARPQSQFLHLCVCERFICTVHSQESGSFHIFPAAEYADQSWEYINCSQTHECGNKDCGRAIPFLGIFVSNFRYWFFAVHTNDGPGVEVPVFENGPAGPPGRPGRHQDAQEPQGPHLRSAAAQFRLTSLTPLER